MYRDFTGEATVVADQWLHATKFYDTKNNIRWMEDRPGWRASHHFCVTSLFTSTWSSMAVERLKVSLFPTIMMHYATALVTFMALMAHKVQAFSIPAQRQADSRSDTTFVFPRAIAPSPPLFMSSSDEDDDTDETVDNTGPSSTNVLGTSLTPCCANVRNTGIGTGFYRNGYCSTGEQDLGRHTVCVQVTDEFLEFSKSVGNDLSTPAPQYMFPGLKDGDIWCLCAQRWAEAFNENKAPKLFLKATHEKTLDFVPFNILREFAIDKQEADDALDELNEQRERLNKLL